ncbi:MAG: hypothetical protein AAFU60_01685 [Bacteroidota bacterium]
MNANNLRSGQAPLLIIDPEERSSLAAYFFLKQQPVLTQRNIREVLEKGSLNLALTWSPYLNQLLGLGDQPLFIADGVCSLIRQSTQKTLASQVLLGLNPKIQWQCRLEQDDCDAIVQLLKNQPSDFHIKGLIKFRPIGQMDFQTQRFLFPLRQALGADFWEHEPLQRIHYKYFDIQSNGYQDLPKVHRLLPLVSKARGQQRTGHLVSVNQNYVSTISAAKPTAVIAADQLIQSPLATYDLSNQLWTLETVMAKSASWWYSNLP